MRIKEPNYLSLGYILSSIFLGPAILILGYSFTRGGGDYCDAVYSLPDGSYDPKRITEFQNAQIFQVIGASIMILLGLFLLAYSLVYSRKHKTKVNIWGFLGILVMLLGYTLVIFMSGSGGQNC